MALDATCWLRSIQMLKDPYADALGGCSPGLFGAVNKELDNLSKFNIQPIFVFDGMVPPLQHQMFQQSPGLQHLENAWTALANNKDAEAQKSFAVATSRINSDICHFVFHYLRSKGYECIRAPYIAGPQLAHMASNNIVQAVLGQPGLLLYGVKKVLLSMDFSKGAVEWVELDYILHQWGINKSQFADVCLLAGTEYCLTYPYLNLDYFQQGGSNFSFQSAVELIKQMPLANWMSNFPTEEMKADHVNGYCVCKALIQHTPVLNMNELQVEPFTTPVPADFSTLIGEKLPQSVYSLLSAGHLSYRLPAALCTGEWNDRQPPLIDSLEYRSLLVELEEYRAKTLGLLCAALPGPMKSKKVTCKSYFEKDARELACAESASRPWLKWKFTKDELHAELKRQQTKSVDLAFCIRWHAHDFQTDGPLLRNLEAAPSAKFAISDLDSLAAVVMLTMLEVMDYISEDGGMTVLGDAILATPSNLLEPVLLALEMMKFGVLNGEALEAPDGKPFPAAVQYPNSPKQTMLISRMFSLVPMRLKNDLWAAKVDFDLASFHCLVRAINRSMRLVTEASLGNVLLSDMSKTKLVPANSQAPEAPSALPAFMLPRACLGIVVKYMLEYEGKNFEADVRKKFPCTVDPVADLKTGLAFWAELTRIVATIAEPLGTTDMLDEMTAAGKTVDNKRRQLGI